jgi:hypothetical protein
MTLEYKAQTNLITISANPSNGAIKIMADAPGAKHPHQAKHRGKELEGYIPFYKQKALQLLGASEFRPLNLLKVAEGIAKSGTTIFEETYASELTAQNTKQRNFSRSDVRDDPAYAAGAKVDGDKRVVESLSGWWLPDASGGKLHRKMWMHLSRKEDMVQFAANLLASEVEYAISRIRAI